ncbi:response regulator [Planktothrix agardhii]|uniref:histidine kinase n=1 Tax=Planktothrix agardhii TaxID=1160 RepID=A0AAD1Q1J9_PLAAG|nr:response regulator [Planktothrix agardhii]MCF3607763.1 response regulator [Planktothrix agardhii 1033]MCB8753190.1 response regulator [Planktothrix agardhii 1810]MCB8788465.1 response regulator [Planktothrix agardhii 1025]MCF3612568.1 response regulator [Planktothrix agardhii 1027]MCF3646446.1 response regulator [Planktothrix agardhii 1026]
MNTNLSNAQTYEAERQRAEFLGELNQVKTAFLSSISHEFRTPLTLILGSVEEILQGEDCLNFSQREQLTIAKRNSLRLLKLVNTLVDFSSIEAERIQAVYEPTDLATLTIELVSMFRSSIERAGIHLIIDCPPLPEPIYIDREVWEKIVMNLFSNALKFTFKSEIILSLRWVTNGIELEVQDTGITTATYLDEVKSWSAETNVVVQVQQMPPPQLPLPQILLVDDNPDLCNYIQRLLSQKYQIKSVNSGLAALESIREQKPDLVITDVIMPELNGLELLQILRHDPDTQRIPIILLSARAEENARIEGLEAKADDYLIKPFSARELLARVQSILEMTQLRQEATIREQELINTKARVTDILESITDGFLSLDHQWRLTYVNGASERLSGKTREELLGGNFWDIYSHLMGFEGEEKLRQVIQTQVADNFETCLAQDNLWYEVHVYPYEKGLAIYWRDITKRKQAEITLLKSEERLRVALKSAPITLFNQDQALRYTWVHNPTLNQSDQEIIDNTDFELFPEAGVARLTQLKRRVLETGIGTREEVPIFADGQQYCFDLTIEPLHNPNHEIIGITCAAVDISDYKRIELALRQSEAQARARTEELKTFMETVPAAVWIAHDPQCHQMTANWAAHELVQLASGSLVTATPEDGSYPFEFKIQRQGQDIPPEDLPMQQAGRTGENIESEFEFVFENGEVRYIYGRAVPLRDEAGEIRGVIGAFLDVSDRKRVEQEREQLLIREQAAREQAEMTNRIKDEFLTVLSHELRSPLNPILGWTKLLQTRKFDSQGTAQALETIERNAKLQTQLIEDLLDISRMLRGNMVLHKQPVNLITIITSVIETFKLAAEAKGIQVRFEIAQNSGFSSLLIYVLGDETRLQQIIWNLLSNGIKFTTPGGIVEIYLKSGEDHVQIQVKDTGIGINPQFLPYVFDYFRQQDGTNTRKFGGLGLGLAIVRHLTELHGGTVSANSLGENLGAAFSVQLPLMKSVETCHGTSVQPQNPEINSINLTGLRVLAIDDQAETRTLIGSILTQAGAQVKMASSAQEALLMIQEFSPDVLVSDIAMPDMEVYIFRDEVRNTSSIPVIGLTTNPEETNASLTRDTRFQIHLAKPIVADELVACVATLTHRIRNSAI